MTENDINQYEQRCSESKIQHICVCWFRRNFPDIGELLFAVPNGGFRGAKTGAQMVYEGQVSGVSDLILLIPREGRSSLCIEFKTPKGKGKAAGRQSENQKKWQSLLEGNGGVYVVCHGIIEFIGAVCDYMGEDRSPHIRSLLQNYFLYR